jgi:hypothetical protein
MPSDPAQRRARLLALLPQIYAVQPVGSAVGSLIEAMAQTLSDFDLDLKRVMHDRWVALACGFPDQLLAGDDDAALDRLGALLQIERLPARIRHGGYRQLGDERIEVRFLSAQDRDDAASLLAALVPVPVYPVVAARIAGLAVATSSDDSAALVFGVQAGLAAQTTSPLAALLPLLEAEPTASYRARMQITVAVTSAGLTTPRALLALAIADLGAEPCPKMKRSGDATVARAMALGTLRRCPACGDDQLTCPNDPLFDAWITEQPAQVAQSTVSATSLREVFTIRNDSLIADRPVLTVSASKPVSYPAIQSRSSGEIVLYADDLLPGATLRLLPQIDADEARAAKSHDRPVSHDWLLRSPRGRAELVDLLGGPVRDVGASIYYLWGSRFDEAASKFGGEGVAGMRCGVLDQAIRSPQLRPGDNDWMMLNFAAPAYRFDAPTSRLAGGNVKDGAHFALVDQSIAGSDAKFASTLFTVLERATSLADGADSSDAPRFRVEVDWVTRPPFLFHLRVPKNGWVLAAELRGAVALLVKDVDRARPVGVRARVDFPEPVYVERLELREQAGLALALALTEDATPEIGLSLSARQRLCEDHFLGEGGLTIGAILDVTRLDSSTLQ